MWPICFASLLIFHVQEQIRSQECKCLELDVVFLIKTKGPKHCLRKLHNITIINSIIVSEYLAPHRIIPKSATGLCHYSRYVMNYENTL